MNDMIKIPFLNMEMHIDEFFTGGTAMEIIDLMKEYDISQDEVLTFAINNFRQRWALLNEKYGHLYGLWDDCIEPQIREWFGFPPSEYPVNEDRRHIYFECRHRDCVEA